MTYEYKHLVIDAQAKKVYYLGYEISFSVTEYNMLLLLISSDGGVSSDSFLNAWGRTVNKGSAKSHVADINKKAADFGGRKLILWDPTLKKYVLNEYM